MTDSEWVRYIISSKDRLQRWPLSLVEEKEHEEHILFLNLLERSSHFFSTRKQLGEYGCLKKVGGEEEEEGRRYQDILPQRQAPTRCSSPETCVVCYVYPSPHRIAYIIIVQIKGE